jgi:hypothetical protein
MVRSGDLVLLLSPPPAPRRGARRLAPRLTRCSYTAPSRFSVLLNPKHLTRGCGEGPSRTHRPLERCAPGSALRIAPHQCSASGRPPTLWLSFRFLLSIWRFDPAQRRSMRIYPVFKSRRSSSQPAAAQSGAPRRSKQHETSATHFARSPSLRNGF